MYDPGVFQTAAFVVDLRTSEFVHRPFKNRVLVSYSPLALLKLNPDDFQSQLLWGLVLLVQVSRSGLPDMGLEPLTPLECLCSCDIPMLVDPYARDVDPKQAPPALLSISK